MLICARLRNLRPEYYFFDTSSTNCQLPLPGTASSRNAASRAV